MRFYAPALKILSGIYKPQGGLVATDRIDLEGTIQLVHDTSREAELASGIGKPVAPGHWLLGLLDVHAGADTVFSAYVPHTVIRGTAGFTEIPDFDVWLMPGTFVWSATAAAINQATSTIWYPPLPGQGAATQRLIMWTSGATSNVATQAGIAGGSVGGMTNGASQSSIPETNISPIFLPVGTTIANTTVSLLASTIQVVSPLWVGAPGARPPGVA